MLKRILASFALVLSTFCLIAADAEARRLGGGRSIGMQRSTVTPKPSPSPAQQVAPKPASPTPVAPAPSGWRRWGGMLAGLAAGIGLAALLSHLGIGAEFAGIILAVAVGLLVLALLRRMFARPQHARRYAGAYGGGHAAVSPDPIVSRVAASDSTAGGTSPTATIPAGFDVAGFEHQAKVQFIRLQAANDSGNLDDIREFTSPEIFAEAKLALDERRGAAQKTDVVDLSAHLLDVTEEPNRYIASVRYHGMLREEIDAAPIVLDEVWHLSKPKDGSRGWILSGIEQVQ